ncbi:MAG: HTTM domain-containing protein [Planctomyces sp.]|uniref:HTTM domain protein n=1 Tax=Rubinisphaera brasiliensis (strain ATCC 49424 / DSM 5305 / JCM 21570 / IAM 15109 / NBRC 103401 / IFAM 1448) TaxID=756272 RepID=F0SFW7_RUBBR|nr:HTTM domain-containing protein [Rubinisphaera brasiliensis]ADY61574.1 HTTM domain protein [Rubinisphaera brasiliensis DSM 5305]MBB01649.1 HTTM domain-containing protein [Planctomyces sp.]
MGRAVRICRRELVGYLSRISTAWTEFWFTPRDPFCLSVMRCLVGWMAFYSTLVWGIELESFVFPYGYNSAAFVSEYVTFYEGPFALSFWYYVPPAWIYPVHYLCLAATFCFMIGLFTRTTSVLSLIIVISYAYRARFSNYGLDQILTILNLYLCLAPSGAYLSVDRLLKRYRSIRDNLLAGRSAEAVPVQPTVATNVATRLVQYHMCVMYFAAGTGKLQGDSWWDGTAMWRSLANAEYQTLDMTWLAYFPWFIQFMTHLTIFWEVSFAFLVWRPLTRPVMLLLGLGMHFGIGLLMGMWTFATCMMFGYLAFVEPYQARAFFHFFKERLFQNRSHVIDVDSRDEKKLQSVAWKKAMDGGDQLQIRLDGVLLDEDEPESDSIFDSESSQGTILVYDTNASSAERLVESLQQQGMTAERAPSWNRLHAMLEEHHDAVPLVNLDGQEHQETQDYLVSFLPLHLKDRPSVTLLRGDQLKWLEEEMRQDYQRVLLLPCRSDDVYAEVSRARRAYQFLQRHGVPGQTSPYSSLQDSVLN